ncbi:hypothetical protein RI367_003179 [Sorochytrium milnesiophthora]
MLTLRSLLLGRVARRRWHGALVSGRSGFAASAPTWSAPPTVSSQSSNTSLIARFLAEQHGITPVQSSPLVYVASTMEQAEALSMFFYSDRLLGLDRETAVNPRAKRKDDSQLPSLIQLANQDVCVLYQVYRIYRSGGSAFPPSLQTILNDFSVIKAGVGLTLDAHYITKYAGVHMRGLLRLEELAMPFGFRAYNLRDLTWDAIGQALNKSGRLQRDCDWDFDMPPRGIKYAAEDAFASRAVAVALLNSEKLSTLQRVHQENRAAAAELVRTQLTAPFRDLYNTIMNSQIMRNVPMLYQPQYALQLLREALGDTGHPLPPFLATEESVLDTVFKNLSMAAGFKAVYPDTFQTTPQSYLNEHQALKFILASINKTLSDTQAFSVDDFDAAVHASPTFRQWSTLCTSDTAAQWTSHFLQKLRDCGVVEEVDAADPDPNDLEMAPSVFASTAQTEDTQPLPTVRVLRMTGAPLPTDFHLALPERPTPSASAETATPSRKSASTISADSIFEVFAQLHRQFHATPTLRRRSLINFLISQNVPEFRKVPLTDRETRERIATRYVQEMEVRGMLVKQGEPTLHHNERPSDPRVRDRQLLNIINPALYYHAQSSKTSS